MRPLAVLVVDDEEDTRVTMTAVLEAEFPGCRVVTADDGEGAIAALDRTQFDLAIVDYRLPYADGLAVARHAASRKRKVPCILVTGLMDPDIATAGKTEGILLGTLHKTASSDELLAFVRRAVATVRAST